MHPVEDLIAAYEAGQRDFGESRLQEALPKIKALPKDVVWHFIGPLQSNKAKKVAENFQAIHTLYSIDQIREIDKGIRVIDGLIEVNIGLEPQKVGILPERLDEFHTILLHSNNVHFRGLMTIGPRVSDAELMRPFFKGLKRLADHLGNCYLSMGMSGDFEVAIQEGASHIRVGSAIFGSR